MKVCANVRCQKGALGSPKKFTPLKEWGLYCSRDCGNAARNRAYYLRLRKRED